MLTTFFFASIFANWNKVGRNLSLGFLFPIPKPCRLTFDFACGTPLGHFVSVGREGCRFFAWRQGREMLEWSQRDKSTSAGFRCECDTH